MDNNGWPGEPGVPLNPERDGWHWLKTPKGRFYSCWWNAIRWIETYPLGSSIDEVWRPAECAYAGPCLTPAEVDARVQQARRDALEEAKIAAKKAGERHQEIARRIGFEPTIDGAIGHACADIRAPKGEGDE
jgi:hypothetical protein